MVHKGAARAGLDDLLASLEQAYTNLVNLHERFVTVSRLDGEDLHAAHAYFENVQALHNACLGQVEHIQRPGAAGGWNVSENVNFTNRSAHPETPHNNDEQQSTLITHNRTVVFDSENEDNNIANRLDADFLARPRTD